MADGLSSTANALEHDDDELAEIAIDDVSATLRDDLSELGRVRRASTRVARRSLVWRSRLDPVVQEKENAGHLDLLGSSCLLLARTAASLGSAERAKLAPQVRELAEALMELAGGLDDRAVRQHAADRGLAVAVEISADDEPPDSAFAAAVISVRMVAMDLMVFAGIEPDDRSRRGAGRYPVATASQLHRPPGVRSACADGCGCCSVGGHRPSSASTH